MTTAANHKPRPPITASIEVSRICHIGVSEYATIMRALSYSVCCATLPCINVQLVIR